MKEKIIQHIARSIILITLIIGLEPHINTFLENNITYEQYCLLIIILSIISLVLPCYLIIQDKFGKTFEMIKSEIHFKKYKKEEKYTENKNFYYRDIPFNKDIFRIFWIAYQYGIVNNRTNLINALIVKWHLENKITFIKKNKCIINQNISSFDSIYEKELFELLKHKKKNRFKKLGMFNTKPILKKIDEILLAETVDYRIKSLIYKNKKDIDVISKDIKNDVDIVFGFKNFLLNFSNINDKSIESVKIWEEYLIYAELLGISKQVRKELKKANINYVSSEISFKKMSKFSSNIIKIISVFSILSYTIVILIVYAPIIYIFIKFTWQ